jgi:Putative quorum-sensing-regulated virulence factor
MTRQAGRDLFGQPPAPVIPFGKHKGQPLADLPDGYLRWLTTIDLRPRLREAVEAELSSRPAESRPQASRGFRAGKGSDGEPGGLVELPPQPASYSRAR